MDFKKKTKPWEKQKSKTTLKGLCLYSESKWLVHNGFKSKIFSLQTTESMVMLACAAKH